LGDQVVGGGFDLFALVVNAQPVRGDPGEDQDVQRRLAKEMGERDAFTRSCDGGDGIGEVVEHGMFGCLHRILLL